MDWLQERLTLLKLARQRLRSNGHHRELQAHQGILAVGSG